jgi:aspartyl-tRNA(Asn)/glutamyl-tRNA(Gln) amidotransferase subunit C
MASIFTRADVLRIAALAHLELTDAEVELFTAQLAGVLEFANIVQQADTTGVPPTSHALLVDPSLRDDLREASLDRAEVLKNAPDADATAGLFKVPKVL